MATLQPARIVSEDDGPEGVRPPLKWAGGKRWQLPFLDPIWNNHRSKRLVEPFCGGLAVTLGLSPKRALLNDINPHLINFYTWLKRGLSVSSDCLNNEDHFYRSRDRFNSLLRAGQGNTAEAAELFYYLNRTGFNGLCRFNRSGEFNVPFGTYKTINYKSHFHEYKPVLAEWEFVNKDFEELELTKSDFIYSDPPYDVEFTTYSKGGFGWEEQERAALWLSRHPGPVVLSNQATPRIVKLYRSLKFNLKFLDAPRRISCTGDRTPAPEVLASRNV